VAKIITYLTEIQLLLKILYSFSPVDDWTEYDKNNISYLNTMIIEYVIFILTSSALDRIIKN
jgi:hypothetical protein